MYEEYEPAIDDVVRVGRHGQEKLVRAVYPISRTVAVSGVGVGASRFLVDWSDLLPVGVTKQALDNERRRQAMSRRNVNFAIAA